MTTCDQCGQEHTTLDLQPSFGRPDVVFALDAAARAERVLKESDDLCLMTGPGGRRFFVRCVLPVVVHGYPRGTAWGFWVETDERAFGEILSTWTLEDQSGVGPFAATVANEAKMYPGTLGLPVLLQPVSATARPRIRFHAGVNHPLAVFAQDGVSIHLASLWGSAPP